MDLDEFKRKIRELRKREYIETRRMGNTGIGYTLEQEIGLTENNIAGPDLENIELKSQRREVSNKVTIFTFNRGIWKIRQRNLIEKYGYIDTTGRKALYCTVSNKPNPQGLYLCVIGSRLNLFHEDGTLIAEWEVRDLIHTFSSKMPNLIMVIADTRMNSRGREEFLYNEAYYLSGVNEDIFFGYIRHGIIVVDIRMHLKESGSVRNHGTAFRIEEKYLINCFRTKNSLLEDSNGCEIY